jgi:peptidoglycan/xylan/chitin deacetylase (PgdA/CDA1 family)
MSGFRLDRIASLYLFGPRRRSGGAIPILMYHSVSEEEETDRHPYYRVQTTPEMFTQQMVHLRRGGHKVVDLNSAARLLAEGDRAATNLVAITFDDGCQDFSTTAFPLLQRFGFTATVFLPTAFIGSSSLTFRGRNCMTWMDVRELYRHGISFGSHSVTHRELVALPKADVMRELLESKITIEQEIGAPVDSFAYPYAFPQEDRKFCDFLREGLQECGYTQAVCTKIGTATKDSDRFSLPRIPVNSDDDPAFFQSKLDGGYDWLRRVQAGVRRLKSYSGFVRSAREPIALPVSH